MSLSHVCRGEAEAVLAAVKYMSAEDMAWDTSPELSTQRVFSSALVDSEGRTIEGLRVELAYRTPPRHDDCKYTFTVFKFFPGGRRRVYQLEVVPEEDFSHKEGNKRLFGPHEHIGDFAREVRASGLDCRHHSKWFRIFLERANIGFGGRYLGPFDGGLFSGL